MSADGKRIRSGRLMVVIAVSVLVILGLVWSVVYLPRFWSEVTTDDAFITGHIISVSARVDGHVQKVYVNDNQLVQTGDLLIEIDPCDFQVAADLAEAARAAAQAGTEQARAQVGIAEVEAKRSEKDHKRYQQLLDAKAGITQQQVDNAAAAAQSALAQLGAANKQVAVAEARASQARASLEQAQLKLSYTKVLAPQGGRITKKSVEQGEHIATGQPLLAIVPPEIWVVANFKETQLKHMKPGQPVRIKVDAYPQRLFKGHIDSIQSGTGAVFSLLPPENATGNYIKVVQRVPVKIVFDEDTNDMKMLSPGMSVIPAVKVK